MSYIEGTIIVNDQGRYEVAGYSLNCGSVVEIWYGQKWLETRIEASDSYYAVSLGQGVSLAGMRARVKS